MLLLAVVLSIAILRPLLPGFSISIFISSFVARRSRLRKRAERSINGNEVELCLLLEA